MMDHIVLVVLSFGASLGFGIVFQLKKKDLLYAGAGGALTRIVYIFLMTWMPYRIAYAAFSACFAAAYAEWLAYRRKKPSTVYLYPAIIPLIPGDLFYYTMAAVMVSDREMFMNNAAECTLALVGICTGFVVCSAIVYYVRRFRVEKK